MKKAIISMVLVLAVALVTVACESAEVKKDENVFCDAIGMPCTFYDNDYFACLGMHEGSINNEETWKIAYGDAQRLCSFNVSHAYKGFIQSSYFTEWRSDTVEKVSNIGNKIIDTVINDARPVCAKEGQGCNRGIVYAYVAIKVSKEELAVKIADAVENTLADEEKVDFNKEKFQKSMSESFK